MSLNAVTENSSSHPNIEKDEVWVSVGALVLVSYNNILEGLSLPVFANHCQMAGTSDLELIEEKLILKSDQPTA